MIILALGLVVAVILAGFVLVSRRETAGDGFWADVGTGREGSLTVDLPCMAAGSYRARPRVIRTGPLYPVDLPGPDREVVQRFSNRAGELLPEWIQSLLDGDIEAAIARDVAHCQRMAAG